jgi:DNA repair protein RadC
LSPDATIDDDIDLLAGLIGRSLRPPAARNAAASLIDAFGGLAGVAAADEAALRRGGLAKAAVADLGRVRALGIAMAREEACQRPVLSSWSALVAYLRAALAHAPREQFRTLYLDKRNILIRAEWRADGTVDHAPVYPREVVRRALELSASALILVHNHPSGDPTPSRADIDMTRKIIDAARVFDIEVHDHVIVGREGTKSLRALGLM